LTKKLSEVLNDLFSCFRFCYLRNVYLPSNFKYAAPLLLLAHWIYSAPALAQAQRSVDGSLDTATLTFDITIQNPADQALVVTKVGAIVDPVSGSFQCLAEPSILLPIGNYVVPFHLTEKKPTRTIDPIGVPPRGLLRLKISLEPDATGACGFWAAKVRAVVTFADGTSLITTREETITSNDVRSASSRSSQEAELRDSLQSSDAKIREFAVRRLSVETLSNEALAPVLKHKLHDPDVNVRVAAADVIANLHLYSLGPDITALLTDLISPAELKHYVGAACVLREPSAVPVLATLLGQRNDISADVLNAGLMNLRDPSVPNAVRPLLTSRKSWSLPEAQEADALRYLAIVTTLVFYHDEKSVPKLSSLLTTATHRTIQLGLMSALASNTRDGTLIQDPFLLEMGPAVAILASQGDSEERWSAITLLQRFPPLEARSLLPLPILGKALASRDSKLRVIAAKAAGTLGYSGVVSELCGAWKASHDPQERAAFEDVAQGLGASCK
jgi:hypothetical protein